MILRVRIVTKSPPSPSPSNPMSMSCLFTPYPNKAGFWRYAYWLSCTSHILEQLLPRAGIMVLPPRKLDAIYWIIFGGAGAKLCHFWDINFINVAKSRILVTLFLIKSLFSVVFQLITELERSGFRSLNLERWSLLRFRSSFKKCFRKQI